jgi:PAS domain S-box-containing protein
LRVAETIQLYEHADVSAYGVVTVALVMTAMLWTVVSPYILIIWFLAIVLLAGAWWLKGRDFFRVVPEGDAVPSWTSWYSGMSAVCGAAFGASGLLALLSQSLIHQVVWGVLVAGIASAALPTHRSVRTAYFSFMLPTMVSVTGVYSYLSDPPFGTLGMAAGLYGLFLIVTGSVLNASNRESLNMRIRNEDLINYLADSETRYRTLFDSSADAIFIMKGNRFIECNPRTLRMFGCTKEQIIGRTPFDFSPVEQSDGRDSREKALELIHRALKGENRFFEWQHSRLDGSVFDTEVGLSRFEVAGEIFLLATVRDITKRKDALAALHESERLLAAILSASPVGIMRTGDRHIKWANRAWEEMFGYGDAGEYVGQPTNIILASEEYYEDVRKTLYDRCLGGLPSEMDVELKKRGGEVFQGRIRMNLLDQDAPARGTICTVTDITEQKLIEKSLRDSEEKYRLLVEKALEGIIVAQDGLLKFANRAGAEIVGYEVDELITKSFTDFLHPQDRNMVLERHKRRLAGEQIESRYTFRVVHKDGAERWVEIDSGVISWEDRPAALFFMTDITNRKRMEEKLLESEAWYRSLVEDSFDGIFIQQGLKIIFANARLYEMLGYPSGELEGEEHWRIYHPDYHEMTRERALARMRGEEVTPQYEVLLQRKDGSSFTGEINARLISVRGEPGVQVWVRDISRKKKAEEVQRRLATAIEQATEAIVITDVEGNINYVNPAFERITRYSRSEAVGKNPRILKSGQHSSAFYKGMWHTISRGYPWTGQFINRRKDGTLYREDATISPVRDSSGKIVNYVAVKRDITREVDLQQQLLQAQRMEAVGTLAGGVAHDFNNLLQVVLGYAQLLMTGKAPDSREWQSLEKISLAARHGADLVKGLLAFSRRAATELRPLNLNNQVLETKSILERTIPRMIKIELKLDDNLPVVQADPAQVEQVLINLAVNARDAMPEGGILTIASSAAELNDDFCEKHFGSIPGLYALLSVSDTGHGMEEETISHIFEPFYTTKEVGKGTGLGLAMVYGIVKQHGGYIHCESEPDRGTTFRVYFPAKTGIHEEQIFESLRIAPGGSETILVVDDEESVREVMCDLLVQAGYRVLRAANGLEALRVYTMNQQQISLVLLDLIMPEMSGKECSRKLVEINPSVKIVLASGYTANTNIEEESLPGVKAFLAKPYEPVDMLDVMRRILDTD